MGGNGNTSADGVGSLTIQRAIDVARNTEGDLDPTVNNFLEGVYKDIWDHINSQPDLYILTRDEFAVFNYYQQRLAGNQLAEAAIKRYWDHAREPSSH